MNLTTFLDRLRQTNHWLLLLRLMYLGGLVYVLVFWRALWTPDALFLMFLMLFALYGQGRRFLIDFGPFVVLLLTYDSLRSLVPYLNQRVHFWEMIRFDYWLGGGVLPSKWLQEIFYPGHVTWLDFYLYFLYMCHFLLPLIVGVLIWKYRPAHYNRYVAAFLVLSYVGFLTYILFPAAPPWMASERGLVPHLHKISTDVWWALGVHDFPTIYKKLSPNMVAAVPSLHAAYPLLMLLFIRRAFSTKLALALSWYPLSIWFGIVYMGEHYIFDIVVGVAYVIGAYIFVNWLFDRYGARARALRSRLKQRVWPVQATEDSAR